MKEITPSELHKLLESGIDLQIIDIREKHEVESGNLGGLHIPMAEVLSRLDEIRRDCKVIIHCKSGSRASAMAYVLQKEKGFANVLHLRGGIEAYASEYAPEIKVY